MHDTYNNNNSSIISDSMMGISSKSKHHKKSIYKNIKQTQLNLREIKRFQDRNILPFSLKQQQQNQQQKQRYDHNNQQEQNFNRDNQEQLAQSDMSEKLLKRFESRNHIGFVQNNKIDNNNDSRHEENIPQKIHQQQHKNSTKSNNLIMLQIHLTIAKKKYTIKVSNQISSSQLQSVIENFLIDNQISNPTKKSHSKTKRSIIQMVQNKINTGNDGEYKKLQKNQNQNNKITNENFNQQNLQQKKEIINVQQILTEKLPSNDTQKSQSRQKQSRFQKPFIQQKQKAQIIKENDSINYQHKYSSDEQACSPSFKSSAYVDHKSPLKKVSHFSPQPKHQGNKYEKIVSNYYNEKVGENVTKQRGSQRVKQGLNHQQKNIVKNQKQKNYYSQNNNETASQMLKTTNIYQRNQQSTNYSTQETEQQKAKSVYQKWKQRQKSKQINGKPNDRQNFTNALKQRKQQTENSFVQQMSTQKKLQKRQKNWNNAKRNNNKGVQKSNLSIDTYETKNNEKRQPLKSPLNNNKMSKQNFNMNKSSTSINKSPYHQRNRTMIDEDYSPNKNMNRTQIVGSRKTGDNEVFQSNKYIRGVKETTERAMTPTKGRMSPHLPKSPINYQNQSKVYTICDEDDYPMHELSPDHFYKQGLVFEAKKKQQNEEKFKSLYPFTTRNIKDSHYTENAGSRNGTMRNAKENSGVSDRSKEKYFSSKLSMNKNNVTTKSSVNIILDQKEKSALHERLYQQNKIKQAKITATEANQRLIKITKIPQTQNQIKIMQENLKHIKGLSKEKKVKLIERNIQIKQKLKEKDRIIDEQLQKMIKQGKVKHTHQIVYIGKSPFRKTKIY